MSLRPLRMRNVLMLKWARKSLKKKLLSSSSSLGNDYSSETTVFLLYTGICVVDFDRFFGLTFKQLSNSGPPGGRLVWSSRLYPTACSWHGGLLDTAETLDGTDQRGFFFDGWFWVCFVVTCRFLFFETCVFLIMRSRLWNVTTRKPRKNLQPRHSSEGTHVPYWPYVPFCTLGTKRSEWNVRCRTLTTIRNMNLKPILATILARNSRKLLTSILFVQQHEIYINPQPFKHCTKG